MLSTTETYFIVTKPIVKYSDREISFKMLIDDDLNKWRVLRVTYRGEATFTGLTPTNYISTRNCKSRVVERHEEALREVRGE